MLLAPGTTLHHDGYVIDALLEEAEDGALYLGKWRDTPVYIQVQPLKSENLKAPVIDLNQDSSDAQHPCLTGILDTFIEDQNQYWVLALEAGQPWAYHIRHSGPLTVEQALEKLHQATEGLLWLMAQGIDNIVLSPAHIWWRALDAPLVLTGWWRVGATEDVDNDFNPQRDLATLLWQWLSGQTTPAPTTVAELQRRLPQANPQLLEGIQLGLNASPVPRVALPTTLTTWLQSLSRPDTNYCPMHSRINPFNAEGGTPRQKASSFPGFALMLTALVAAFAGVGGGMAWRLAPSSETSKTARFSPDQGFPALSDWSGGSPDLRRERAESRSGDRWRPREFPQEDVLIKPPHAGSLIQSDYLESIPDRWADPIDAWAPSLSPLRQREVLLEPTEPSPPLPVNPRDQPQEALEPPSSLPVSPAPEIGSSESEPVAAPVMTDSAPDIESEPVPLEIEPEAAPAPAPASDLSTAES